MPEQFEFLVLNAPERLRQQGAPSGPGLFGVRLDANRPELASDAECVIVAAAGRKRTKELLKLLDLHGAAALRSAIRQALERNTPRASSVAFLLSKQQRSTPAPLAVDLSRHPAAQAVHVQPHSLETYDELARHDEPPKK